MTTSTIDYAKLADTASKTYTTSRDARSHAAANNTQRTPTVAAHAWHYTAMSAATFTLSALLAYIATEAICKCARGRNTPAPNTPTSAKHLHV